MTKVSREEVLHIARISAISLREEEVAGMVEQLEQMLTYAKRVTQVAGAIEEPLMKNKNVMRSDLVVPQHPAPILAQAPKREENYFVVPMILDN